MAPSLFETLRALQDAGIPSGLKVDDEGITAWVQHFAHDRIEKVTWMGVTNDGSLGSGATVTWAEEAVVAMWLLESALRSKPADPANSDLHRLLVEIRPG